MKLDKIWFDALALGMNEGLRMSTIQGQIIDLTNNCKNQKHKDFLEKLLKNLKIIILSRLILDLIIS